MGLADPTSAANVYETVLTNQAITEYFGASYNTATPPITADNPMPTTFSDLVCLGGFFNLTIHLQNGVGDLVVKDLPSAGSTATLVSASVPEPASLTLSGLGFALLGLAAWRRTRRSAGCHRPCQIPCYAPSKFPAETLEGYGVRSRRNKEASDYSCKRPHLP